MARRRRRKGPAGIPFPIPRIPARYRWIALALNVFLLVVGLGWYATQSRERQEEIQQLVGNYLDANKRVDLSDLALDLWRYYYGGDFIDSDFRGGQNMAYGGIPEKGAFSHSIRVLHNSGYLCGYADAIRSPVWVAYRLFDLPEMPEVAERPDVFTTDDRTFSKVRSSEFTGSGYDRGHLAPNQAIALCYGPVAQEETFLMSNIIPQYHTLNAGPWKTLEQKIIHNYTARFREIWVLAGPAYDRNPKQIGSGLLVPDYSYKILVDETDGQVRMLAFLMPAEASFNDPPDRFLTTVDAIEERTGLDFFPLLPDEAEARLESHLAQSLW